MQRQSGQKTAQDELLGSVMEPPGRLRAVCGSGGGEVHDELHDAPHREDEYDGQQHTDQDEVARPATPEITLASRVFLYPEKR